MSQQNNSPEQPKVETAKSVYLYTIVFTIIVGGLLSVVFNSLRGLHALNTEKATKADILTALPAGILPAKFDALEVFEKNIEVVAVQPNGTVFTKETINEMNAAPGRGLVQYSKISDIDLALEDKLAEENRVYPFYTYTGEDGKKIYLVSIRGNGLWNKIWGTLAIDQDLTTILGVSMGHAGETPGLGAEIKDSKAFKAQFEGKQIFQNGVYAPVGVKKKNLTVNDVQAIAGSTVTCDGVHEMLYRGLGYYVSYINSLQ